MRSNPRLLWIACLAGMLAVSGVGCSDNGGPKDDSGVTPGAEIHIGLVATLTGATEQLGKGMKKAAEMAAKEINAAGGVLDGQKLVVDTVNEEGDGFEARVQKFIDDPNVVALLGPVYSSRALLEVPLISGKIITISPSATSPELTAAADGNCFFRNAPSDALQAVAAAKYAVEDLKATKAAILHVGNQYGKGLAAEFKKAFEGKSGQVLTTVEYDELEDYSSYDFTKHVADIFKDGPDLVYMITYQADGGKFLSTVATDTGYQAVKSTVKFMGADGNMSDDFAGAADPTVANGRVWGTYAGSVEDDPNFKAYTTAFRKEAGLPDTEPATPYTAEIYDGTYLIAYAIEKAGKVDRLAVRDALKSVAGPDSGDEIVNVAEWAKGKPLAKDGKINYEGASGPIDYDDNGDPVAPCFKIWAVKDGKVATLNPCYEYLE